MTEPREGDILAGKFRIERVLGIGGMGMVVSAMHLHLDERVAIKFLLPEALANPEAVARFGREARAAVKIRSEHVARVIDVGALETGAPYMVMELLRGRDLSTVIRDSGALPVVTAVEYILQACEALAEAHALGIVHRDLKPANLFLTTRADGSPCVKVLDFGISKVTQASGSGSDMGMTRTQSIMGSPLYMSPEQMASARDVDQRSDIWAVGTVLYELITGSVPFVAETMPQLCTLILHAEPPPPRSLQPGIPAQLEAVIMRCLRKHRGDRYDNVGTLAADLAPFVPDAGPRSAERISRVLSSSGISSKELPPTSRPARSLATNTTSQAWGTTQASRGSRAVWVGLAAMAALLGAGVMVWRATTGPHSTSPGVSGAAGVVKPPVEPAPPALTAPAPVTAPHAVVVRTPPEAALPLAAPPSAAPVKAGKAPPRAAAAKPRPGAEPGKARPSEPSVDPLSERN
jgi:eukaryotic-like serine/threonine-protein kinase